MFGLVSRKDFIFYMRNHKNSIDYHGEHIAMMIKVIDTFGRRIETLESKIEKIEH